MEGLIRYFVKYNLVGDLLMIALLVSGWVGLGSIKSNFFPVIESKTIQIQVIYPGASPAEIEEGIVAKIEENLQGIAGLDQVKSVCSETGNITVSPVKIANETDDILQDVKNAVDRIASFPGAGMEPPIVFKQESEGVAITFAVTGVDDLRALKREARRIERNCVNWRASDVQWISRRGNRGQRADRLTNFEHDHFRGWASAIRSANIETTRAVEDPTRGASL